MGRYKGVSNKRNKISKFQAGSRYSEHGWGLVRPVYPIIQQR